LTPEQNQRVPASLEVHKLIGNTHPEKTGWKIECSKCCWGQKHTRDRESVCADHDGMGKKTTFMISTVGKQGKRRLGFIRTGCELLTQKQADPQHEHHMQERRSSEVNAQPSKRRSGSDAV